jgi:CheY-like chemotaxis protein
MKRILLIEDDYELARSILLGLDLLELTGLEKEVQYEGISALVRIQSPPALDVLLLDMHLPNLAGQDIYEDIRQKTPACKVIIITADARLVGEIHSRLGDWASLPAPDAVFIKPFSLRQFLAAVRDCLNLPHPTSD